jgi:hypothetical protein
MVTENGYKFSLYTHNERKSYMSDYKAYDVIRTSKFLQSPTAEAPWVKKKLNTMISAPFSNNKIS